MGILHTQRFVHSGGHDASFASQLLVLVSTLVLAVIGAFAAGALGGFFGGSYRYAVFGYLAGACLGATLMSISSQSLRLGFAALFAVAGLPAIVLALPIIIEISDGIDVGNVLPPNR
ncbi:MAG: hypothetical protein AAGH41_13390 [Pseudomonadota bacterium]